MLITKKSKFTKYNKITKKILNGGASRAILPDISLSWAFINNKMNERSLFFLNKHFTKIANDEPYVSNEHKEIEEIIKLMKKTSLIKQPIRFVFPDYHGKIDVKEDYNDTLSETLINNNIVCFFTQLGKLGDGLDENLGIFLKNLIKREADNLFRNIHLLMNDINTVEFKNHLFFNNCFSNSVWYFPGQKFIDIDFKSDINCKTYIKYFSGKNNKGTYIIENESFKDKKLSNYINTKYTNQKEINIYFIRTCRGFYYTKYDDKTKDSISKLFKHEIYMYYLNKYILKEYAKKIPADSSIYKGISNIMCNSELKNNYYLEYFPYNERKTFTPLLNYNNKESYVYNRIGEQMINFYNNYLFNTLNEKDYIWFISLSLKKQFFLLYKLKSEFTSNKSEKNRFKKLIGCIMSNYNMVMFENIILDRLKSFPIYMGGNNQTIQNIDFMKYSNDYYFVYKELTKQLFSFISDTYSDLSYETDNLNSEIMEKMFEYNDYINIDQDEFYYTYLDNINNKILLDTDLFFKNMVGVCITDNTTESDLKLFFDYFTIHKDKRLESVYISNYNKHDILKRLTFNINLLVVDRMYFSINELNLNTKKIDSFTSSRCTYTHDSTKFITNYDYFRIKSNEDYIKKLIINVAQTQNSGKTPEYYIIITKSIVEELDITDKNLDNHLELVIEDAYIDNIKISNNINLKYLEMNNCIYFNINGGNITCDTLCLKNYKYNHINNIKYKKIIVEGDFSKEFKLDFNILVEIDRKKSTYTIPEFKKIFISKNIKKKIIYK